MKKGFTLVEIIISITLIIILGVSSLVIFNKYGKDYNNEKFLEELKSDVIVFLNITRNESNRIQLTPGNHFFIKLSDLIDEGLLMEEKSNPFYYNKTCAETKDDYVKIYREVINDELQIEYPTIKTEELIIGVKTMSYLDSYNNIVDIYPKDENGNIYPLLETGDLFIPISEEVFKADYKGGSEDVSQYCSNYNKTEDETFSYLIRNGMCNNGYNIYNKIYLYNSKGEMVTTNEDDWNITSDYIGNIEMSTLNRYWVYTISLNENSKYYSQVSNNNKKVILRQFDISSPIIIEKTNDFDDYEVFNSPFIPVYEDKEFINNYYYFDNYTTNDLKPINELNSIPTNRDNYKKNDYWVLNQPIILNDLDDNITNIDQYIRLITNPEIDVELIHERFLQFSYIKNGVITGIFEELKINSEDLVYDIHFEIYYGGEYYTQCIYDEEKSNWEGYYCMTNGNTSDDYFSYGYGCDINNLDPMNASSGIGSYKITVNTINGLSSTISDNFTYYSDPCLSNSPWSTPSLIIKY